MCIFHSVTKLQLIGCLLLLSNVKAPDGGTPSSPVRAPPGSPSSPSQIPDTANPKTIFTKARVAKAPFAKAKFAKYDLSKAEFARPAIDKAKCAQS